jgi:MFS-type transporter involved in bile tolerance (Atg22 family)
VGTIIGLASLSFSVGAIAGPFLAGYIFDSTGSYDLAFFVCGIFLAVGSVSLYFVRAPKGMAALEAAHWRAGTRLG